jgi:hypothetical protein
MVPPSVPPRISATRRRRSRRRGRSRAPRVAAVSLHRRGPRTRRASAASLCARHAHGCGMARRPTSEAARHVSERRRESWRALAAGASATCSAAVSSRSLTCVGVYLHKIGVDRTYYRKSRDRPRSEARAPKLDSRRGRHGRSMSACTVAICWKPRRSRIGFDIAPAWTASSGVSRAAAASQRARTRAR